MRTKQEVKDKLQAVHNELYDYQRLLDAQTHLKAAIEHLKSTVITLKWVLED